MMDDIKDESKKFYKEIKELSIGLEAFSVMEAYVNAISDVIICAYENFPKNSEMEFEDLMNSITNNIKDIVMNKLKDKRGTLQ